MSAGAFTLADFDGGHLDHVLGDSGGGEICQTLTRKIPPV